MTSYYPGFWSCLGGVKQFMTIAGVVSVSVCTCFTLLCLLCRSICEQCRKEVCQVIPLLLQGYTWIVLNVYIFVLTCFILEMYLVIVGIKLIFVAVDVYAYFGDLDHWCQLIFFNVDTVRREPAQRQQARVIQAL